MSLLSETGSTNEVVKALARQGAPEGTVILASHQTAGKGRRGRRFYSPAGTGIYVSLLYRPGVQAEETLAITTMAAVACCIAIEKVSGKTCRIKWVNDVYLEGKKVVGILTEAGSTSLQPVIDYAVLGIGINIFAPEGGFPEELQNIAGAVYPGSFCKTWEARDVIRGQIAGELLNQLVRFYPEIIKKDHRGKSYMEAYRERSLVLGEMVRLLTPDHQDTGEEAKVLSIGDQAELLVETADGKQKVLRTGDVSIRLRRER